MARPVRAPSGALSRTDVLVGAALHASVRLRKGYRSSGRPVSCGNGYKG